MTVVGGIPVDTASDTARPLHPVFDASELPTVAYGSRTVTWWGTAGFMIAEAATLGACLAAYYYVRRNFTAWPPLHTPLPDLVIPTISLVVLILSVVPCYLFAKAAERYDKAATQRWMWVAIIVMLAATALRLMEFRALNVRWDANAYASVAWALVFTHFTLLLVDAMETLVFAMILTTGKAPPRFFPGFSEDAFYTYFMVLAWIPCYVTVYLVPHWT